MYKCDDCGKDIYKESDHDSTCSRLLRPAKRRRLEPQVSARSSDRVRERQEHEMQALNNAAYGVGHDAMPVIGDITPQLYMPLEQGNDNRFYTSRKARRSIENVISSTRKIYKNKDELPKLPRELLRRAENGKQSTLSYSTRNSNTGYRVGQDVTFTEYTGADYSGTRVASDTPRPRSPSPETTGEGLLVPNLRYEQTHQAAYRFTGAPGRTVHAPTQANQVADTTMERFISTSQGSFMVREDTFERSTIHAYRSTGGGYESRSVSYMRRMSAPQLPTRSHSSSGTADVDAVDKGARK